VLPILRRAANASRQGECFCGSSRRLQSCVQTVIERLALSEAGNSITRAVRCVPAVQVLAVPELGFGIQTVTARRVALFGAWQVNYSGNLVRGGAGPPAMRVPLGFGKQHHNNANRAI